MILALGVPTHAFASTAPAAGEAHPVARHGWTERGEVCGGPVGGDPQNVVQVVNQSDSRFRVRGQVQFNVIEGREVTPVNFACGESTGTAVKTIVVALQINVYDPGAHTVAPENAGIALNIRCTGCFTRAEALQSTTPLDEDQREELAEEIAWKVRALNRELGRIARAADANAITIDEANARIDNVISRFKEIEAHVESLKAGDGAD
jgi:hypothetical protein